MATGTGQEVKGSQKRFWELSAFLGLTFCVREGIDAVRQSRFIAVFQYGAASGCSQVLGIVDQ